MQTTPSPAPQNAFDPDAYADTMAESGTPLLGHLVLYSIFDGEVTREDLERWFRELDLDPDLIPPRVRNVDAYEKVTGPDGVRMAYPLDDPTKTKPLSRRESRLSAYKGRSVVTLMMRPVRRDGGEIIRHVVREVRDEQNSSLSYETKVATVVFERDNSGGSVEGAGALHVEENHSAIEKLPEKERDAMRTMLTDIQKSYSHRCRYLSADKLRSVIRRYVESLSAIRVRPTGGVYFVHRQYADDLAGLRELVAHFGGGSHLSRIPLPDQEEMREMIISAFTTKAKDDLNRLAHDIAAAQAGGKSAEAQKLYATFDHLQQETAKHSNLLSASLDDTNAALNLVKMQLASLLATDSGEDQ